jgi:Ca-activated chloride channel family protein
VVFAGTAFLQSPLSADYEILREFLPALGPDYFPRAAPTTAPCSTPPSQPSAPATAADRFLVVLSDGEATDDDWKKTPRRSAKRKTSASSASASAREAAQ